MCANDKDPFIVDEKVSSVDEAGRWTIIMQPGKPVVGEGGKWSGESWGKRNDYQLWVLPVPGGRAWNRIWWGKREFSLSFCKSACETELSFLNKASEGADWSSRWDLFCNIPRMWPQTPSPVAWWDFFFLGLCWRYKNTMPGSQSLDKMHWFLMGWQQCFCLKGAVLIV